MEGKQNLRSTKKEEKKGGGGGGGVSVEQLKLVESRAAEEKQKLRCDSPRVIVLPPSSS